MRTFSEFMESLHRPEIPQNTSIISLSIELPHELAVRVALYCAKDCLNLTNKGTRQQAERCIDLVEQWLENPHNRENLVPQLRTAYDAARNAARKTYDTDVAAYAASYASAATIVGYYASDAAQAAASAHANKNEHIRQQKIAEYRHVAINYLTTYTSTHPHNDNEVLGLLNALQDRNADRGTLAALLDKLIDTEDFDAEVHENPDGTITSSYFPGLVAKNIDDFWEMALRRRHELIHLLRQHFHQ